MTTYAILDGGTPAFLALQFLKAVSIVLTNRDKELIEALTLRVHLMTLDQAVENWWPPTSRAKTTAQSRFRKLESAGWLTRKRVNIHPMLPLKKPVVVWSPGDAEEDFGPVAYRLQKRWTQSLKLTTVLLASRKAANHFGGFGGKFKHRTQLTHDVHLAEVYLRYLRADGSIAKRWQGEEIAEKDDPADKLPDATIVDVDGVANLIVEFGGSYDRRRVEKFHRFCERKSLPYELW